MTPVHHSRAGEVQSDTRERSAQAIVAADQAPLRDAIESVKWEERGFLRRLVRADHDQDGGADA